MILDWKYNVETKIATVDVVPGLRYETPDGGQTINKFVDGELVDTFHKFGPDRKFKGFDLEGGAFGLPSSEINDEWPSEVAWLASAYPDAVGPLISDWDMGFLHKDGEILEQRYLRALAERKGQADARLDEFRWLLEELRVSLFAQELRTPQPVSVKRLEKAWDQLQR